MSVSNLFKKLCYKLGFDSDPELTAVHQFIDEIAKEVISGVKLLDAGAGQCQYKNKFSHTQYIAVDFAQGDKGWDYSNLDITCSLHKIPLETNSIGAIICIQVMEHIPNPAEVLAELFRVLRPGCALYISVPFASGEHQIPHDYYRYTRYAWSHLLKQAGFNVNYIRPVNGYFFRLFCELRVSGKYLKNSIWHVPFLMFQIFLAIFMRQLEKKDHDQVYTGSFHIKAVK